MIESTLKIATYCPLVIQGFSNFLGLFQGIMANPELKCGCFLWKVTEMQTPVGFSGLSPKKNSAAEKDVARIKTL